MRLFLQHQLKQFRYLKVTELDESGGIIGVSSGGTSVGVAKTLNFIGSGNTVVLSSDER